MSRKYENYSSTKYKNDRFHLSNISFAGPVVLGIGGKISWANYVLSACRDKNYLQVF